MAPELHASGVHTTTERSPGDTAECNEEMLAIAEDQQKMRESPIGALNNESVDGYLLA
jgi:hypothetical protein